MSKEQIAAFKKLYPMNARPVQALNGRVLQESGV
jgi:carbonic anhydrase